MPSKKIKLTTGRGGDKKNENIFFSQTQNFSNRKLLPEGKNHENHDEK